MGNKIAEEIAVIMYASEPCRICGKTITADDILRGAVFAGYSSDGKSRSAHKDCSESNLPKNRWQYPEDAL